VPAGEQELSTSGACDTHYDAVGTICRQRTVPSRVRGSRSDSCSPDVGVSVCADLDE
jgi:hypothetical protein